MAEVRHYNVWQHGGITKEVRPLFILSLGATIVVQIAFTYWICGVALVAITGRKRWACFLLLPIMLIACIFVPMFTVTRVALLAFARLDRFGLAFIELAWLIPSLWIANRMRRLANVWRRAQKEAGVSRS
jgi:hypothetical protein